MSLQDTHPDDAFVMLTDLAITNDDDEPLCTLPGFEDRPVYLIRDTGMTSLQSSHEAELMRDEQTFHFSTAPADNGGIPEMAEGVVLHVPTLNDVAQFEDWSVLRIENRHLPLATAYCVRLTRAEYSHRVREVVV